MNILINGASRGIGAEMVRVFTREGHCVVFTYKNSESEAKALEKETGALSVRADSADDSDVKNAVDAATDHYGKTDVLINNAAISKIGLFTETSAEEWNEVINVNLNGFFRFCRAVLPQMISAHYGKIINISSMWGICGSSCEVAYSTSKAAVIGMTKALAKEVGPSNITVNCIAPGLIETEMNSSLSDETVKSLVDETPMMRIGTTRDVAELALFLADDKSGFITGEVVNVNGGFLT